MRLFLFSGSIADYFHTPKKIETNEYTLYKKSIRNSRVHTKNILYFIFHCLPPFSRFKMIVLVAR